MEGNLLGSEGTESPDSIMGLSATNRLALEKMEKNLNDRQQGSVFSLGG